jgi:hypothetical protein
MFTDLPGQCSKIAGRAKKAMKNYQSGAIAHLFKI